METKKSMTAADRLRQEMLQTAPFTKQEFINTISERIRKCGCADFYCHYYIDKTDIKSGGTILPKDLTAALQFAHEEGFKVTYHTNSFGARYVRFSL